MARGSILVITCCGAVMLAAPMLAQTRIVAPVGPRSDPALRERHQIFVMEDVLQRAVELGVQTFNEQLRAAGQPNVVLFGGMARARGVRLEGYGVFFDLEVPAVRQSIAWSLRMMDRADPAVTDTLTALRNLARGMSDATMKANVDALLKKLEARVGPPGGASRLPEQARPGGVSAATVGSAPSVGESLAPSVVTNPTAVYTTEVVKAVIDAMFDYGAPMNLGPSEWLTVAARDDMDRFAAADPDDVPRTWLMRVRGSDLMAFREGRLSREEAIARVEVKEF